MTSSYRDKALDAFIRGLNGDLPRLLSIREPATLPQALHLCQKLDNMTFRQNYAQGIGKHYMGAVQQKPSRQEMNFKRQHFYPELAYVPTTPQRFQNTNQRYNQPFNRPNVFPPNQMIRPSYYRPNNNMPNYNRPNIDQPYYNRIVRPSFNTYNNQTNTAPRPIPMEIDSSSQFRHNSHPTGPPPNYKRPHNSQNSHPPHKIHRNFHLETTYPDKTNYEHLDDGTRDPMQIYEDPNGIFSKSEIPFENNFELNNDVPTERDNINFLE